MVENWLPNKDKNVEVFLSGTESLPLIIQSLNIQF